MTAYPSAEKLLAQIDEVLNRYATIIERCAPVFRQQAYDAAFEELKMLKVHPADAAKWLRGKGWAP